MFRLFVGGLPWNVRSGHLKTAFQRFGNISKCYVILWRGMDRSRGFGFVTFKDPISVTKAVKEGGSLRLFGTQLVLKEVKKKRVFTKEKVTDTTTDTK